MACIIARFSAKSGPESSVMDPPLPALLTFQPMAWWARAISMMARWCTPTSSGWSAACAAVLSIMLRPKRGRSPAQSAPASRAQRRMGSSLSSGRAAALQLGDHLLMHVRRIMRLADKHEAEARLQLPQQHLRHVQAADRGVRILVHIDEIDTAVRGGDLVLNAALQVQHAGLNLLGRQSHLVGRQAPAA
ncbi:MAG: hypothetical protein IPP47_00470 [Bryobacterales bacterium]|nr:hypothetical protein [Bryobacterales bacterium]